MGIFLHASHISTVTARQTLCSIGISEFRQTLCTAGVGISEFDRKVHYSVVGLVLTLCRIPSFIPTICFKWEYVASLLTRRLLAPLRLRPPVSCLAGPPPTRRILHHARCIPAQRGLLLRAGFSTPQKKKKRTRETELQPPPADQ